MYFYRHIQYILYKKGKQLLHFLTRSKYQEKDKSAQKQTNQQTNKISLKMVPESVVSLLLCLGVEEKKIITREAISMQQGLF